MKRNASTEFLYQLFALITAAILVHAVYVTLVRPQAEAIVQHQMELQEQGEAFVTERSLFVVLKDYEQEACFILMLWALAIMGYKAREVMSERKLLQASILNLREGVTILPEDARDLSRPIQSLPITQQAMLLPRSLLKALQRFDSSKSVTDAANAVRETCETESDRLDSELAMIRYIAWAIPSIGFIGTVRGIGEALGQAHKAVEGDIAGVTVSLGVAFNSTFIALVISIVVMFFTHQLQLMQERLVLDTENYCDSNLLRFLTVRD
ncbi:MotA/TolQ/ExbB proton channel family protein [Sessilibacter corallicola]|uniref:MotA/TolQ/ExbB proton channel domain-containing protein n=1 Tax=Sessilibacter corallicola TaxID=2904075 RepID=A0ABQ0A6W8_9GAMM|nr:MotA/TolQ/ExbB proton channel family protein [Sessilibacter corallicola]MCE2028613.1 MotA/TolQ/ExbB proton channel family protein [Sessilibacter corallicola]